MGHVILRVYGIKYDESSGQAEGVESKKKDRRILFYGSERDKMSCCIMRWLNFHPLFRSFSQLLQHLYRRRLLMEKMTPVILELTDRLRGKTFAWDINAFPQKYIFSSNREGHQLLGSKGNNSGIVIKLLSFSFYSKENSNNTGEMIVCFFSLRRNNKREKTIRGRRKPCLTRSSVFPSLSLSFFFLLPFLLFFQSKGDENISLLFFSASLNFSAEKKGHTLKSPACKEELRRGKRKREEM